MTIVEYQAQLDRLIVRFTDRSFDPEFCKLAWKEVGIMSQKTFERVVDVWLGSRRPNQAPLLAEFREARIAEEKHTFQADVRGAANFLNKRAPTEMRAHLKRVLSQEFGGVADVSEAFSIAKLRLEIKKQENK